MYIGMPLNHDGHQLGGLRLRQCQPKYSLDALGQSVPKSTVRAENGLRQDVEVVRLPIERAERRQAFTRQNLLTTIEGRLLSRIYQRCADTAACFTAVCPSAKPGARQRPALARLRNVTHEKPAFEGG